LLRRLKPKAPRIGDDCAIVPHGPDEDLLFTTDFLIEDVHFRRRERSAADIGYRALARSLSDIAAMGGDPKWATLALALPEWADNRWIAGFYRGFLDLADRFQTELIGGDLSRTNQLAADVMVCGTVPHGRALRRGGGRPGDSLYVSGPLGAGQQRRKWRFTPQVELGRALRERGDVTAAMDLSDGIALDLRRLALESQCQAHLDHIPVARGATLEDALYWGEDYELIFATRPDAPDFARPCERIGQLKAGDPGAVLLNGVAIPPRGYDHFARPRARPANVPVRRLPRSSP
jgi:thiamine-monophosphate kinase